MMSDQYVLVKRDEHIAVIIINRPESMNALNIEIENELLDVFGRLTTDEDVRAIILEGAGGNFSVGGDLAVLSGDVGAPQWLKWLRDVSFKLIQTMRSMPQPIICKVRGNAFGYGMSVALAGDFVIASENARFCLPFVNIGLTLDGGAGFFLPRLVGMVKARRLAFLGEVISGKDAAEMGLIHMAMGDDDLDGEADRLARTLAGKPSAMAVSAIKEALEESFQKSLGDTVEWEAMHQAVLLQSEEFKMTIKKLMNPRRKT
jgi:2-(1,2-epoxy-1,2-dihydrophenyl)acetyl-CoA isomerase